MKPKVAKCPCCGWSEAIQEEADKFQQWLAARKVATLEATKHLPRGDCQSCIDNNAACNYSCVGI